MAQYDARIFDGDRPAEETVAPAALALLVRPLRELLGRRLVTERDGALADDEAEHDLRRIFRSGHGRSRLTPRSARPGSKGARLIHARV